MALGIIERFNLWRWEQQGRLCAAWDPPDASHGRDTHICHMPRWIEHKIHKCKCSHTWRGRRRA